MWPYCSVTVFSHSKGNRQVFPNFFRQTAIYPQENVFIYLFIFCTNLLIYSTDENLKEFSDINNILATRAPEVPVLIMVSSVDAEPASSIHVS